MLWLFKVCGTKKPLIIDACKQGSEKTIYALVMDLNSTSHHHTSTPLPCVTCQELMENNSITAVVGRYFNKNQHVSLLIITQIKPELSSDSDTLQLYKSLTTKYNKQ